MISTKSRDSLPVTGSEHTSTAHSIPVAGMVPEDGGNDDEVRPHDENVRHVGHRLKIECEVTDEAFNIVK